MSSWETLLKRLPPSSPLSQCDRFSPVKTVNKFTIPRSTRNALQCTDVCWDTVETKTVQAFEKLGFPYDISTLAVGNLFEIFKEEVLANLRFSCQGPLLLYFDNRCCIETECPLRVFFRCCLEALLRFVLVDEPGAIGATARVVEPGAIGAIGATARVK